MLERLRGKRRDQNGLKCTYCVNMGNEVQMLLQKGSGVEVEPWGLIHSHLHCLYDHICYRHHWGIICSFCQLWDNMITVCWLNPSPLILMASQSYKTIRVEWWETPPFRTMQFFSAKQKLNASTIVILVFSETYQVWKMSRVVLNKN